MKRDLTSFALWNEADLTAIFTLAQQIKSGSLKSFTPLAGKSVALVFERESLRTRVSFEVGIAQLGGFPIFLQQETIGIATRESVHDIGSVLSQYNELIVARTTKHQTCIQLAESATVPVINAMTDLVHPCQVLADVFTLKEMGRFSPSTRVVFVGNGNNIANSWLEFAEKVPMHLVLSCPSGYEPHLQMLEQARGAKRSKIEMVQNPIEAVKNADVVYTDVLPAPAGQKEKGKLRKAFRSYQVNARLLAKAKPDCVVMHRLPANRGEEITSEVLDGKQSIALQQAANRLHVQKGIIGRLLRHDS